MTVLLDTNVLIALIIREHVHHEFADQWLARLDDRFATCPITEGGFIRMALRQGQSSETAAAFLSAVADDPHHEFWSDHLPFKDMVMTGVIGHRQVTDAYLAHLARSRADRLATFDQGFAKTHPDVVDLIPTG